MSVDTGPMRWVQGADSAAHIAVVGDTSNDLLAGTCAGAGIVAGVLTGAHRREQLRHAPHTHILDSVDGLIPLVDAFGASGELG
ncbi:HAD hydrolase-like protein [Streptomyces mayteni]